MTHALLTHEIGSLSKPAWRVKGFAGKPLSEAEIKDAQTWGERLAVPDYQDLIALLEKGTLTKEDRQPLKEWASLYGMRLLESAGLELVYDGEQQRSEMYAAAVALAKGFEFLGTVRSFDNKYYNKAAVRGPISLKGPFHDEEFEFLKQRATSALKVPITGAYTIADWSFDEYYNTSDLLSMDVATRHKVSESARRDFVLDVARNLIRPNLQSLIALGAEWIQVDEPGGSTEPDELDLFVESFNVSVEGLDATFSTHLCFSDYELFFPAIEGMTECQQFCVGFANDDTAELGTTDDQRPGYRIIKKFRDLPYEPALGLGVLDIHTDFIEPPELVRDRIIYAVETFGGPERIHVTPDCGLRTRTWDVAYSKLVNMVAGVELAKKELGL